MKEFTFVTCNPSRYDLIERLSIQGFSLDKFYCVECKAIGSFKCSAMNCNDLYPISFQGQYVGALVTAYDSLEVVICDSKSEAFASALESEGWHQVSNHGTLACREVIDLKSWYVTLEKKLIVSVGPHNADFKIMSFEELYKQEGSERDLAELNPIAELLGKPTQLTKEEDAYNKGHNDGLKAFYNEVINHEFGFNKFHEFKDPPFVVHLSDVDKMLMSFQKPTNSKKA
jgi:hypothetical protein